MDNNRKRTVVNDSYGKVAIGVIDRCCCTELSKEDISRYIGYKEKDIDGFSDTNPGLGCGNPIAFGNIEEGSIVLDLGSGAGFDSFIAAQEVGEQSKAIGVDMTADMIDKARKNAEKYEISNVEF